MNNSLESIVGQWMRLLKIPISKGYLHKSLLSHPAYPSATSITDVLDYLGIDNAAMVVDKEKINEIPVPFMAHVNSKRGDFVLVSDTAKLLQHRHRFLEEWDGVVIMAEKPQKLENTENQKWVDSEKRSKWVMGLSVASVLAIIMALMSFQFSFLLAGLIIATIAGLGVSCIIVQHELGFRNTFTEKLCAIGKNADCDAVLNSKKSKLFSWLSWADVGVIWFSSILLILIISLFNSPDSFLFILLTPLFICALLFSFLSLYYQWQVVKKWCPLCLLTIVLLWLQSAIILSQSAKISFTGFSLQTIYVVLFFFIMINTIWIAILKPALSGSKKNEEKYYQALRFKNNPVIFSMILNKQRKVDPVAWENDWQLGNANSPVQIMVACNPYCGPCAQMHKVLDELITRTNFGLTIRFGVNAAAQEDERTKAVAHFFQLVSNKQANVEFKRSILNVWYADMDMDKFIKQYPLQDEADVSKQLINHEEWAKEAAIEFTPTLFINGYMLPEEYKASDLIFVLKENIVDNLPLKSILKTENKAARAELAI